MSATTNIEWATHTASPWFGCSKVSPGCTNCYAEALTLQKKWAGWGDNSPRVRSKGFWEDAYRYNRKAEGVAERPRMFTSLMDWLDPRAPTQWLAEFLGVIRDCHNLDWLLLTKRPELFDSRMIDVFHCEANIGQDIREFASGWRHGRMVPQNVWFGVTVENQEMADKRILELLRIPARIRWLSVEPLLEHVELGLLGTIPKDISAQYLPTSAKIHWVVVGGESGSKRRDCGVKAINDIVLQCWDAMVPCFVKQDCAFRPGQQGRISDEIWKVKEYPQ